MIHILYFLFALSKLEPPSGNDPNSELYKSPASPLMLWRHFEKSAALPLSYSSETQTSNEVEDHNGQRRANETDCCQRTVENSIRFFLVFVVIDKHFVTPRSASP